MGFRESTTQPMSPLIDSATSRMINTATEFSIAVRSWATASAGSTETMTINPPFIGDRQTSPGLWEERSAPSCASSSGGGFGAGSGSGGAGMR